MVLQKKTINNVPTLIPLTADTGSGVPVGTIIGQYKKVNMSGYLYLDGSTFDQTLYPALYAYLGTNVLPDYREFVLVGAEQNTTSATIADHDVFTQGQEKDDQLQNHYHLVGTVYGDKLALLSGNLGSSYINSFITVDNTISESRLITDNPLGRHGTTTRTKEKAVFWYIKATTGIIESEATEMLNVFNNRMFPDYAHPISIPNGHTWTATEDCYLEVLYITADTSIDINSRRVTIDGNLAGVTDATTNMVSRTFTGYVKKGQVVSSSDQTLNLGDSNQVKAFPLSS